MVRRLLCFWGPNTAGPNSTPMSSPASLNRNDGRFIKGPSANEGEPCWWTAEVNAQEIMRANDAAEGLRPLPVQVIEQDGVATSKLWAEVTWHREGIGSRAIFDISAGMRISVHACSVQINIWHPPQCLSVRGSTTPTDGQQQTRLNAGPGLYLDTLIRASIICGCAAQKSNALLTQTLIIPAQGTAFLPVPPGAIAVEIYVPGAGFAIPGNWVDVGTADGTTIPPTGNIGNIPFLTIAAERTGRAPRPGSAVGLSLANTDGTPRVFTVVWYLEY